MARPKRDLFYEREENAELYLTHEWLSAYDRNSSIEPMQLDLEIRC